MILADYVAYGGLAIGLWVGGYCTGVAFRMVKQVFERAVGLGT
jgi:cation transport regulator ChaC